MPKRKIPKTGVKLKIVKKPRKPFPEKKMAKKAKYLKTNHSIIIDQPHRAPLIRFGKGPCCAVVLRAVKGGKVLKEGVLHADFGSASRAPRTELNRLLKKLKKAKPDEIRASFAGGEDPAMGRKAKNLLERRRVKIDDFVLQSKKGEVFYAGKAGKLIVIPIEKK